MVEAGAYDALASVYDGVMQAHTPRLVAQVEVAVGHLRAPFESIVDVGCGTGALLAQFATRGVRVIGIEPSPAMRERASDRLAAYPNAEVRDGELVSLALAAPTSVVSATFEVVNHLDDGNQLRVFLERASDALVPGGIVHFDASTSAWFETMWSHPPRTIRVGDRDTLWSPSYDRAQRRGVMRVELVGDDGEHVTDCIVMRPFDHDEVVAAIAMAGLERVEARALTGVQVGPRTGRIAYTARRAR